MRVTMRQSEMHTKARGGHYIDDCTPTRDQGQSGQGKVFELIKRSSKESRVA